MKDLISREALCLQVKKLKQETKQFRAWDYKTGYISALSCVEGMIAHTGTVDAVEVVRCKDCAYRGNELKCPMCFSEYFDSFETDYGMDCAVTDNTTDDGFCHKGARMDDEERSAAGWEK